MKIRLVKKKSIEDYAKKNVTSWISFKIWISLAKRADWKEPGDISKTFCSADLLGNGSNRVVFDIAGNKFRMICKYSFGKKNVHLYIKWIGTHAQYTTICKQNKQYNITSY